MYRDRRVVFPNTKALHLRSDNGVGWRCERLWARPLLVVAKPTVCPSLAPCHWPPFLGGPALAIIMSQALPVPIQVRAGLEDVACPFIYKSQPPHRTHARMHAMAPCTTRKNITSGRRTQKWCVRRGGKAGCRTYTLHGHCKNRIASELQTGSQAWTAAGHKPISTSHGPTPTVPVAGHQRRRRGISTDVLLGFTQLAVQCSLSRTRLPRGTPDVVSSPITAATQHLDFDFDAGFAAAADIVPGPQPHRHVHEPLCPLPMGRRGRAMQGTV